MSKFSIPDKLNLAQLPTPIQYLPRLSKSASVHKEVNIFVKRDDVTHGPAAGNKIRKLEFLFQEAIAKKSKVVFTCGGLQSNHARATALIAKQLGLECVLFLRGEPPKDSQSHYGGNHFINYLLGVEIHYVTADQYENISQLYLKEAERFKRRDGVGPYFIPEGGSNEWGALGYMSAFNEIQFQCGKQGLPQRFDSIVMANGSGGTHAGLLLGAILSGIEDSCKVISFNVCKTSGEMSERVKQIALAVLQRFSIPISFMPSDIRVIDGYVGPGYAIPNEAVLSLIKSVAQQEGLLLDPVYTGKALWGLMSELARSKESADLFGSNILFLHTGGLPSLFAFQI
jgi:D-cysteine desulfhydrase